MNRVALILVPLTLSCAAPDGAADGVLPSAYDEPLIGDRLAAPSPPEFALEAGNLVAGQVITFTITGAPPNSLVMVGYSTAGLGDGPCAPGLGDRCVGLLPPVNLLPFTAFTNGAGNASLTIRFPDFLANTTVSMQAAVGGANAAISNPIGRLVLPPGTTVAPNADSDADGFSVAAGDCNDFNSSFAPNAPDAVGDGIDFNCDNADGVDGDGDGASSFVSGGDDCNDTDATVSPGAREVCDGVDNDCDASVDGPAVCSLTETFPGVSATSVPADILFVVDDSCSMSEEQGRLATVGSTLFQPMQAAGVDFHVGVITTDASAANKRGRLQASGGSLFIDPTTPTPLAVFTDMVNQGTGGAIDERGRRAVDQALVEPLNFAFFRADSDLHIVTLSDENDSSANNPTRSDFIATLQGLKAAPYEVNYHSIVGPAGGCATADPGTEYLAVTSAIGGEVESICVLDYGPVIDDIANDIAARGVPGPSGYQLADTPDPSTIVVQIDIPGVGVVTVDPSDWVYDPATNTVDVTGVTVPSGSTVLVTYDL